MTEEMGPLEPWPDDEPDVCDECGHEFRGGGRICGSCDAEYWRGYNDPAGAFDGDDY